jgi:glutamine amidotransferase
MIAIVDYRAGNLTSVKLACEALKLEAQITDDPAIIGSAERVIFPGVGAAEAAMGHLHELGLVDTLTSAIADGKPFLGICVGMQLLFDHSEEDGGVDCLGLIPGNVVRFTPSNPMCKIPHMGWNAVNFTQSHPLLTGVESGSEFYFVHSYYAVTDDAYVVGKADYADANFTAITGRDNVVATQFHVEKSGRIGLQLLKNFSEWDGTC